MARNDADGRYGRYSDRGDGLGIMDRASDDVHNRLRIPSDDSTSDYGNDSNASSSSRTTSGKKAQKAAASS